MIKILSAKKIEATSVWTPLTRPAACFVAAGNGEVSVASPFMARFWISANGVVEDILALVF